MFDGARPSPNGKRDESVILSTRVGPSAITEALKRGCWERTFAPGANKSK